MHFIYKIAYFLWRVGNTPRPFKPCRTRLKVFTERNQNRTKQFVLDTFDFICLNLTWFLRSRFRADAFFKQLVGSMFCCSIQSRTLPHGSLSVIIFGLFRGNCFGEHVTSHRMFYQIDCLGDWWTLRLRQSSRTLVHTSQLDRRINNDVRESVDSRCLRFVRGCCNRF